MVCRSKRQVQVHGLQTKWVEKQSSMSHAYQSACGKHFFVDVAHAKYEAQWLNMQRFSPARPAKLLWTVAGLVSRWYPIREALCIQDISKAG